MFLGYMEQSVVYNAINFAYCGGYGYGAYCNVTTYNMVISSFMCPSDTQVDKGGPPNNSQSGPAGWGGGGEQHISPEHQQLPRLHRHDHVAVQLAAEHRVCVLHARPV